MSLSLAASALALVWVVAPALAVAVAVLWVFVLIAVWAWVIRPITEYLTKPGGGFFRRVVFWPVRKAAAAVDRLMREQIAAARRYIAANARPLVLLFDQQAEVFNRIAGTLGDMSEQIYVALWTLNHETIPRKIQAALVPIRNILTNHTRRLDAIEDLNRRVAVEIGNALDALPWGKAGTYVGNFNQWLDSYRRLWDHVFGPLTTRLNDLYAERVPELERAVNILRDRLDNFQDTALESIRNRLERLEDVVTNRLPDRIARLERAVDVLSEQVIGVTGAGLLALLARIEAMEAQLAEFVGTEVATLAERVTQLELELETRLEALTETLTTRIDAIEETLRGVVETRFRELELKVETLADQVFAELEADFSAIVGRIVALEQRIELEVMPELQRIGALLEPAAFGALVLVAMRNVAPNLFCRNVTTTTQRICATDEAFWEALLAGTLIFGLALDPRVIARAGQEFTQGMAAIWRETALR